MISDYVPSFLLNSLLKKIYENQQSEIDSINLDLEDLLNQFFVSTATWGLDYWEDELGIVTNYQRTYEERRRKILSKLRGQGISTVEMIKSIAQTYANEADVIENNKEYSFLIDLISSEGFSYALEDLYETIREIKPAHLEADYRMTSVTNDSLIFKTTTICGEEIRVFPWQTTNIASSGEINIALGQTQSAETITILPKGEI